MTIHASTDIKERLARKAMLFQQLFKSPLGEEALEYLKEEFTNGEMFSQDPLSTAYKLGARDVVIYIQQMVKFGDKS